MKLRICLLALFASVVCSAAPKSDQLVYHYPGPTGEGKGYWLCPAPPANTLPNLADRPWPGCMAYDKAVDYFRAGSVVQLWVIGYPMLSRFKVAIQGEVTINPDLAFIRGISDAQPASEQQKADATAATDAANKPNGAKAAVVLQPTGAAILDAIRLRDVKALNDALNNLKTMRTGAEGYLKGNLPGIQAAAPLLSLTVGSGTSGYPGPALLDIEAFATDLDGKWQMIDMGSCLREATFQNLASETDLLVQGVKDFNSRLMTVRKGVSLPDAALALVDIQRAYRQVAEDRIRSWRRLSPAFPAMRRVNSRRLTRARRPDSIRRPH